MHALRTAQHNTTQLGVVPILYSWMVIFLQDACLAIREGSMLDFPFRSFPTGATSLSWCLVLGRDALSKASTSPIIRPLFLFQHHFSIFNVFCFGSKQAGVLSDDLLFFFLVSQVEKFFEGGEEEVEDRVSWLGRCMMYCKITI
jgi:hypothetical protein